MQAICIFSFESPQPPTMAAAITFARNGLSVTLVSIQCSSQSMRILQNNGVKVVNVLTEPLNVGHPRWKQELQRFAMWPFSQRVKDTIINGLMGVRRKAWRVLNATCGGQSILYIATAKSALLLGQRLWTKKYIFHILELYENESFALRAHVRHASVVVDVDIARAGIAKVVYGLDKFPFVIPNITIDHPRKRRLDIQDKKTADLIAKCGGKKIVIYQGGVGVGRPLEEFAKAMKILQDEYVFLLLGNGDDEYLKKLRAHCPTLVHVDYVEAPLHLHITSHADIGVLQYSPDSLNNVFCAPNKVWEYSGFGIPVICPRLPSLQYYYDRFRAGEYGDFDDPNMVVHKILLISKKYSEYYKESNRLYDSVDLETLYSELLRLYDSACRKK
jgi:glycosyltransferase involved in cell wall biosynthesis